MSTRTTARDGDDYQRSLPLVTATSTPSQAFIEKFVSCAAIGFRQNRFTTCFISSYDASLSDTERRIQHFKRLVSRALDAAKDRDVRPAAVLAESGDFAAVALWDLPCFDVPLTTPQPDSATFQISPSLIEWREKAEEARKRFIGEIAAPLGSNSNGETAVIIKPHYHLSFIARTPGREAIRGAVRALIDPFLRQAVTEEMPAWLEATSPDAVAIYEHFGFRKCCEIRVGVGKLAMDGAEKEGGPGITAYGMIYDSHL